MDKETLAKSKYHGPEGYNCAQAVLAAFRDEFGLSEDDIASCQAAGGGRAEGGICGAAHAVKVLLNDPNASKALEEEFLKSAGAATCREIRKNGMLHCRECVGLAARFLAAHPGVNKSL